MAEQTVLSGHKYVLRDRDVFVEAVDRGVVRYVTANGDKRWLAWQTFQERYAHGSDCLCGQGGDNGETQIQIKNELNMNIRWRLYNFAFRLFGQTRLWPKLGQCVWR